MLLARRAAVAERLSASSLLRVDGSRERAFGACVRVRFLLSDVNAGSLFGLERQLMPSLPGERYQERSWPQGSLLPWLPRSLLKCGMAAFARRVESGSVCVLGCGTRERNASGSDADVLWGDVNVLCLVSYTHFSLGFPGCLANSANSGHSRR